MTTVHPTNGAKRWTKRMKLIFWTCSAIGSISVAWATILGGEHLIESASNAIAAKVINGVGNQLEAQHRWATAIDMSNSVVALEASDRKQMIEIVRLSELAETNAVTLRGQSAKMDKVLATLHILTGP